MKTIITKLLILTAVLSAGTNIYAYDFEVDGIYYNIISSTEKTIEVTYENVSESNYSDCFGNVVIPDQVTYNSNTYRVIAIGDEAFEDCDEMTSITIPNSVTSIGYDAFYECTGLKSVYISDLSVWCKMEFDNWYANPLFYAHSLYLNGKLVADLTIPDGITEIKDCAFYGCSGLTSVTIPNSVTSIGNSAFHSCSGLTFVTIPNSVTSIGDSAFHGCSGLTFVTIPNSVTSIGQDAFNDCYNLKSAKIPSSTTSIGYSAFRNCFSLSSLNIDYGLLRIADQMCLGCASLKTIIIPNSVNCIEEHAFNDCVTLESLVLSNKLVSIERLAFENCKKITEITSLNPNPPILEREWNGIYPFDNKIFTTATLYVPASALKAYREADGWKKFVNIKEVDFGSVDNVENDAISVTAKNSLITISGADNIVVEVYNLSGQLVYSGTDTVINVPSKGIYLVRISGKTFKIAVL